jgi:hypothetical protein
MSMARNAPNRTTGKNVVSVDSISPTESRPVIVRFWANGTNEAPSPNVNGELAIPTVK